MKLLVPLVLSAAALSVSVSASAQSADAQAKKLFRLANFLIQKHQPEAACKILKDTPTPAALQANRLYLMSHCLRDQGKTGEAIKTLEGVVKLLPNAATPRVELATLYINQGKLQAAHTQLIAAAQYDTDPDSTSILRHAAEQLGANDPASLARAAKAKPWSVEMFAGLIYDTNINGGPNSTLIPGVIGGTPVTFKLGGDARPKSAWGATENLSASYMQTLGKGFSLLYQGGLTRTDYFDESTYRNDSMSLATALVYQGKDYSASIQPSLRYVRQTDLLQEADTGVTARVTKMLGPTWNITGSVFYTDRRIEQDRSRDARAIGATFGSNALLAPNLKVGADYTFLREHADDDAYSRHMNGPSIYAVWKPRADLQLIANYRYLHSTYDKAMTYFPDPREDKQSTIGLTALWDISRFTGHDMAVRVQYIYVDNPSNVGTTDYDRQLVMTGLQIGF